MITDVKLHIFRQIATNYTKKFIKNLCPILILFSGDVDCWANYIGSIQITGS